MTQAPYCQCSKIPVHKPCIRSAEGLPWVDIAHHGQFQCQQHQNVGYSELLTFSCVTHADAAMRKLNLLSAKWEDTTDEFKHDMKAPMACAFDSMLEYICDGFPQG